MIHAHTAEAMTSAGLYHQLHTSGRPATLHGMSIAIGRQVGTRATAVARELGKRLGWKVYDHELLERIAFEMKLGVSVLEDVDERHANWLAETLRTFGSTRSANEAAYITHLVHILTEISHEGHSIVVGRGAPLVLPAARTLRVRLVGTKNRRVAVVREELGLSQAEAERHVEHIDQERSRFVREHFHKDPAGADHYDLVINSLQFSVGTVADMILAALHAREHAEV